MATLSSDATWNLWNIQTGEKRLELKGFETCRVTPDGKRIAATSSGSPWSFFDAHTGKALLNLPEPYSYTFSLDGKRMVAKSSDNIWRLFNAQTGEELRVLGENLKSHAFSPDGEKVAAYYGGNRVCCITPELNVPVPACVPEWGSGGFTRLPSQAA